MGCFSMQFWEQVCIFIVIVIGLWSIVQLLLPYLLQFLPAIVVQIIRIIIWVVIAIFVIILIFGLLQCLLSAGGGLMHFPR